MLKIRTLDTHPCTIARYLIYKLLTLIISIAYFDNWLFLLSGQPFSIISSMYDIMHLSYLVKYFPVVTIAWISTKANRFRIFCARWTSAHTWFWTHFALAITCFTQIWTFTTCRILSSLLITRYVSSLCCQRTRFPSGTPLHIKYTTPRSKWSQYRSCNVAIDAAQIAM